ncbi:MAG: gliding motility-associated C-terminal domain-containing protein [Chitinophagales bacterium]
MTASGSGTWTAAASNPASVSFSSFTSPTASIGPFTIIGNYTFFWSNNNCADTVNVVVNAIPTGGSDQSICQFSIVQLAASGMGNWTSLSTNPSLVNFSNASDSSSFASGFSVSGTYQFLWSKNGCSDTVGVNVISKPKAGSDQVICQFSNTAFHANGQGVWSALSSNPVSVSIVNSSDSSSVVTGFSVPGNYLFEWKSNTCSDTVQISVTAKPNAGNDWSTCRFSTVKMNAHGLGTWTSIPGNPSAVTFSNSADSATTVSGFSVTGNYLLKWTKNGCSDTAIVHVIAKPNAGIDQTTCQFSAINLNASGTGVWTALSGNPSGVSFSDSNDSAAVVSGFNVPGTYQFVWTANSCADTTKVIVAVKPNAGVDQTICQFASAIMQAHGTGRWDTLASNPSAVIFSNRNDSSTSISGFVMAGDYYFIWKKNTCADTVVVHVTAKPDAGTDQGFCLPGAALTTAVGSGVWTSLSTNPDSVTIVSPSVPNTAITGFHITGNYSFVWTVQGCSDTTVVIVTPPVPAGADQTICQFSGTVLNAAGSGYWANLPGNPEQVSFNDSLLPNAAVSGFSSSGTYALLWQVIGCNDTLLLHVTPKPSAGIDQIVCQYSNTHLAASGLGIWDTVPGNPASVSISNRNDSSAIASGFSVPGNYLLKWTVNGCDDTMQITVTAKPNAGSDQVICLYAKAVLNALGNGHWTAASTNPASTSFVNPNIATTTVNGFITAGDYYFVWNSNGCEDTVMITVPSRNSAGTDQIICEYATTSLNGYGVGIWSNAASNPSLVNFNNATSGSTLVSNFLTASNYLLVWTSNGCTDTVGIQVTPKPTAGPDGVTCLHSNYTAAAHGNGIWTAFTSNPTATTFVASTDSNTLISGFDIVGNYGFVWTVNGCTDTFIITVKPNPDAGSDQTICQFSNTNLAASGSGNWASLASNPAVISYNNTTDAATFVSGFLQSGIYKLEWTANGCHDTAVVNVTAKPNAGNDQAFCLPGSILTTASGNGFWTALPNPNPSSIQNSNQAATVINGYVSGGIYEYEWTVNGCADTMQVEVTPQAPAGTDFSICQYELAQLHALGHGSWSLLPANPAVLTFSNVTDSIAIVSGFTLPGNFGCIWTVNGCSDTVMIQVTAKPFAGNDLTVCQFATATMNATGIGFWDTVPGNPALLHLFNINQPNTVVSGWDQPGIYLLKWTVGGCSDTIAVTVTPKPDAGSDLSICQFESLLLQGNGSGFWDTLSGNPSSVSFVNNSQPNTVSGGYLQPGTYTLRWSWKGCSDTTLVQVTAKPFAGNDQTICQYATTTLNATGNGQWSALTSNPAVAAILNFNNGQSLVSGFVSAGNYGFVWTTNGCSDTVFIKVTAKPNAGNDQVICQYSGTAMEAFGTGSWTNWMNNPDATSPQSNSPSASIGTFSLTGNFLYIWTYNGCSDTTMITVHPKPNAGNDQLIPINTSTQMQAAGTGTWVELSTNPVTVTFADASSSISAVSGFSAIGIYDFEWIVNGCPDSVAIQVKNPPAAGNDTAICKNTSAILFGSGNGSWSAAAGNPANVQIVSPNALITSVTGFTTAGNYEFYLSYPGLPSDTVQIYVNELPVVNLTLKLATCTLPTGAAYANGSGGLAPYQFIWNDGSTADSVIHLYYNTPVAVTITDSRGCKNTDTGTVTTAVLYLPITLDSLQGASCHDSADGQIKVLSVSSYHYSWSNGDTTTAIFNLRPGSYALTVSDGVGCYGIDSFVVNNPVAGVLQLLPADTTIYEDHEVRPEPVLIPYTNSAVTAYNWWPGTGLSCTNCENPVFSSSAGTYNYRLEVSYNNNCKAVTGMRVVVMSEHVLYIPNAFSPNADGANDIFEVYTKGLRYENLQIFDRWGELIFETEDPKRGWDGTFKGVSMEPGVYVYQLHLVYNDGYETHQTGSITLIK